MLVPVHPPFSRQNPLELVIFCGSPGSGKSTYYWNTLEPLDYERVNQDTLKSVLLPVAYPYLPVPHTTRPIENETNQSHQRPKCLKVAKEYLVAGKSVAVGMYATLSKNLNLKPKGINQVLPKLNHPPNHLFAQTTRTQTQKRAPTGPL